MSGLIDTLLPNIDAVLGVRDSAGVSYKAVYVVTRTWSGTQVGDGTPVDTKSQMLPSPGLKNFAQDIRLREGGSVKSSDIILTNVSKNKYKESDLDATSPGNNVEKLYLVGDKLYQVINIAEKPVTFDVQIRELSNQTRYGI